MVGLEATVKFCSQHKAAFFFKVGNVYFDLHKGLNVVVWDVLIVYNTRVLKLLGI